jgi:hypothetical protein
MRKRLFAPLAICALVAFCARTNAEDANFLAIPDLIPTSTTLDVAGGVFDTRRRPIPCAANLIKGKIRFDEIHGDPKWKTVATVILNPLPKKPEVVDPANQLFAIQFATTFTNTNAIPQFMEAVGPHTTFLKNFSLPLIRDNALSFQLSWNVPGTVTALIDRGQEMELPIDRPVTSIGFTVSSAKATVEDVELGHLGPNQAGCPVALLKTDRRFADATEP